MSIIATTHDVATFDSKSSKPLAGQRLARIGYKKTKDVPNPLPSVCVSLPPVAASDAELLQFKTHIVAMIETAQDGIVRALNDASVGTLRAVSDEQVSIAACLEFMNAESAGNRLTKEKVIAWTEDSGLADALRLRFAELLGVSENPTQAESDKIEQQVAGYKLMFGSLSGAKTYLSVAEAKKLQKALQVGEVDDSIAARFSSKLQEMIDNPKDAADLMAL